MIFSVYLSIFLNIALTNAVIVSETSTSIATTATGAAAVAGRDMNQGPYAAGIALLAAAVILL